MNKPLVSIIIVTYNAANHLSACLESIKQQNRMDLQLIVIDGGSTDGTLEIISVHNNMIGFWLSEPDKGIYDAMNKGLDYVKGKLVMFLGADDLLEDGFKNMLEELTVPNGIYYGMVNVNNLIYKDPYSSYRLAKLNICHQAIFYPRAVFEKYRYNPDYPVWADWFLNIQCWNDPDYQFIYKSHLISRFGLEGISSQILDTKFEKDRHKILLKYFGVPVLMRFLFRELKYKLLKNKK